MPKSASVWLVRKTQQQNNYDYQFNFFKRHAKTKFGGFWAHPGGLLEDQDLFEKWEEEYPDFIDKFKGYHDLQLRI